MKVRFFNDIWKQDDFDVTNKVIEIWYHHNNEWNDIGVTIKTNDGRLQSKEGGGWERPTIPVNMKQLRERVKEFIHADLPCFYGMERDTFLVTMRNDCNDTDFVELAEWW